MAVGTAVYTHSRVFVLQHGDIVVVPLLQQLHIFTQTAKLLHLQISIIPYPKHTTPPHPRHERAIDTSMVDTDVGHISAMKAVTFCVYCCTVRAEGKLISTLDSHDLDRPDPVFV